MIWQTEDSILFKKIQKPLDWDEVSLQIETLGSDPSQPILEEISEIVHEVRRQRS